MSTAAVVARRGDPVRTRDRTEAGRTFRTLYYADGQTFVIDLERDAVCETAIGETEGLCYPCDYGPGAGSCP